MYRNQINLNSKSIEENKTFLTALYNSEDLERARKWFDKLDCSVSITRQDDPDMDLEKFLDLMVDTFNIGIQIGSPFSQEIRYCAYSTLGENPERFAWIECPYSEHNYSIVSRLFKQVYGQDIESIPVPDSLQQYHQ